MSGRDDHWIFASGRSRYCFDRVMSISFDERHGTWSIGYGHDGTFWSQGEETYVSDPLDRFDLLEVAAQQLVLWGQFKEWLECQKPTSNDKSSLP